MTAQIRMWRRARLMVGSHSVPACAQVGGKIELFSAKRPRHAAQKTPSVSTTYRSCPQTRVRCVPARGEIRSRRFLPKALQVLESPEDSLASALAPCMSFLSILSLARGNCGSRGQPRHAPAASLGLRPSRLLRASRSARACGAPHPADPNTMIRPQRGRPGSPSSIDNAALHCLAPTHGPDRAVEAKGTRLRRVWGARL